MDKKTERIAIRVTSEEKLILMNHANKYRTSLSNYLIASGLNKEISVRYLPDIETEKLKIEVAHLGRNLWLLVRLKRVFQLSETFNLEILIKDISSLLTTIRNKYDH